MPIIKSAKKRVRQTSKATVRNAKTKRNLRDSLKIFNKKPTSKALQQAQSDLDKAAKKGLIHKNKVARKKAQLAKAAKEAGVKPASSTKAKALAKKPAAKKTVVKKAPAKKPTAKKTTKK